MGSKLLRALSCALLNAAALLVLDPGAQQPLAADSTGPLAHGHDGTTISVRPLDDPANPYRGQYGALEEWLYTHAETLEARRAREQDELEAQRLAQGGQTMPLVVDWEISIARPVTAEGWLLPEGQSEIPGMREWPQARTPREAVNMGAFREEVIDHNDKLHEQTKYYFLSAAPDALPEDLRLARQEQRERRRLEHKPLIPVWLGSRPPLKTQFMPNGEILTYGELGLTYELPPAGQLGPSTPLPQGETWYRYSATGQLLGTLPKGTLHGFMWVPLYWPELQETVDSFPRQGKDLHAFLNDRQWISLVDNYSLTPPDFAEQEKTLYAAWLYDGTPLDPDGPLPDYRPLMYGDMDKQSLTMIYGLQQKYGLTDLASVSPYEGQPAGPQAVEPQPRPWPKVAGGVNGGGVAVRVLPRDDPANRYSGRYTQWDDWVWQQHGARRPAEERIFFGPGARQRAMAGEAIDFYLTWHMLWVPVEDNGALLPLAEFGRAEAQNALGWDRRGPLRVHDYGKARNYSLSTQGELSWEQWAALMAEKLRLVLDLYPQVPDWLERQPVSHVDFVPNGDIVCHGPLNSFDITPGLQLAARYKQGRRLGQFIYGADGKLKGQLPFGANWVDFYHSPELKARLAEYAAQGCQVEVEEGFTRVYASPYKTVDESGMVHHVEPAPPVIAAFDWDGTELDISRPLTRPDYHCLTLAWHEVRDLAAVRALRTAEGS